MNNIIEIDGEKAVIAFDPDIQMLRGEFVGLNGGADFYQNLRGSNLLDQTTCDR